VIWLLLACDAADSGLGGEDECADAPMVTWENYGEAILAEHCQSCHASTANDRYGAPEGVAFDTIEQVRTHRVRILAVTDPATRTMPPAVALEEIDYERLRIWLTCWDTE
jgi:uncharacterized membrane protein